MRASPGWAGCLSTSGAVTPPSLDRATTSVPQNHPFGRCRALEDRPRCHPETGSVFVHTAPRAQHDRPKPRHCGVRRTPASPPPHVQVLLTTLGACARLYRRRRCRCCSRVRRGERGRRLADRVRHHQWEPGPVPGHDPAERQRPRPRPGTDCPAADPARAGASAAARHRAGAPLEPAVCRDIARLRAVHSARRPQVHRARSV